MCSPWSTSCVFSCIPFLLTWLTGVVISISLEPTIWTSYALARVKFLVARQAWCRHWKGKMRMTLHRIGQFTFDWIIILKKNLKSFGLVCHFTEDNPLHLPRLGMLNLAKTVLTFAETDRCCTFTLSPVEFRALYTTLQIPNMTVTIFRTDQAFICFTVVIFSRLTFYKVGECGKIIIIHFWAFKICTKTSTKPVKNLLTDTLSEQFCLL